MSPAWALEGGGATPQPLHPPRTGLIAWYKGDNGLEGSGGLATSWADSSGHGQDLDQFDVPWQPSVGLDDIDGIPCVSFPVTGPADHTYLYRSANLLDRIGNPIVSAAARTVVAIVRPVVGEFAITGGPVFTFFQQDAPIWMCIFDLESNFSPDGAYIWSSNWRDPSPFGSPPHACEVVGGIPDGPFIGTPTKVQWQSSGSPNIVGTVNGVARTLSHGQYGLAGPIARGGIMLGNVNDAGSQRNFNGSLPELLVYDWDLDAPAQTTLDNYLASRYPSVPL